MAKRRKEINYLFQIKAFYEWLEQNDLSAAAIALWHGLFYMWNISFWSMPFTPAMTSIIARTGLGKTTILRARNELKAAGLLTIKESGGRSPTRYNLVPFVEKIEPLYKPNQTKLNQTKPSFSKRKESEKLATEDREKDVLASTLEAYERNKARLEAEGKSE